MGGWRRKYRRALSHDYRVHSQRYLLRRMTMLISKSYQVERAMSALVKSRIYPIVFLTAMGAREASAGETSDTPSITLAKDQCNKYSGAKFIRI
jgi:hypothetical protein